MRSPAKLNLYLKVLSKRKDGYHQIQTLFERVDLCDRITLRPAPRGIRLICDSKQIPAGAANLAYRAAKALKDRFRVEKGVVIRIEKNIPVASGLGGGSSNAATVLLGLNRLWRLRLSRTKLMRLGAQLGSDVPFFLLNTPFALGRGRGHLLEKVGPAPAKLWHVIVKPPFGISTKEAYGNLKKSAIGPQQRAKQAAELTPPGLDVRMTAHSIFSPAADPSVFRRKRAPRRSVADLLYNSLELALNKRLKAVSGIKKELIRTGAQGALLSGSGSAVFGIYASRQRALMARRDLSKKHGNWRVFVASTC